MQPTNPPAASKPPAAKPPEAPKADAKKPVEKPVAAAPADTHARKDLPTPSHVAARENRAVPTTTENMSGRPGVSAAGGQKLDTETMSDQPSEKHTKK